MATTVKANCPMHGHQEVPISDVHLTVYSLGDGSYYEFRCPDCADLVRKRADEYVISLLRGGSVAETFHRVPAEWAEHDHDAPPITWDEVLDLALDLQDNPDLFNALLV